MTRSRLVSVPHVGRNRRQRQPLIVDEFHQRVLKFVDPLGTDGVPDLVLGQSTLTDQATVLFSTPLGVVVDSAGNVYVTDLFNDRVRRFDQPSGNMATATQSYIVSRPHDLAIDGAGALYGFIAQGGYQ
ncbi:MAG: hypothetical protein R2867_15665 [Caldilineaceae bacterium]